MRVRRRAPEKINSRNEGKLKKKLIRLCIIMMILMIMIVIRYKDLTQHKLK